MAIKYSLKERLDFLAEEKFEKSTTVKVKEKNESGRACIVFSSQQQLLSISLSEQNRLHYINYSQVADGTVLEFLEDDTVNLHIVEIKRTINSDRWIKVKNQFEGGLINSFGLCGVLNQKVKNIILYTAYVYDRFKWTDSADPVDFKNSLGSKEKISVLDWNNSQVGLLHRKFTHVKIKLNANGNANYTLRISAP